MSKYTAKEVEAMGGDLINCCGQIGEQASEMLEEFAIRLHQEEEEAKRDPVKEPRPGDRVIDRMGCVFVFHDCDSTALDEGNWQNVCEAKGATIIRRREVQS